jgi:hypothetical protein
MDGKLVFRKTYGKAIRIILKTQLYAFGRDFCHAKWNFEAGAVFFNQLSKAR